MGNYTVRRQDATDKLINFDELIGEKREDGRFHIKLKDGSEGILMREAEIAAERKATAEAFERLFGPSETQETDKRSEPEKLIENWPNARE